MKIKLDENLPYALLSELIAIGHEVDTCEQEGLGGASDPTVFTKCVQEIRLLVTLDLDFANIRSYPPGTHAGIVVLRMKRQDVDSIVAAASKLFLKYTEDELRSNLVIVDVLTDRVRFRRAI